MDLIVHLWSEKKGCQMIFRWSSAPQKTIQRSFDSLWLSRLCCRIWYLQHYEDASHVVLSMCTLDLWSIILAINKRFLTSVRCPAAPLHYAGRAAATTPLLTTPIKKCTKIRHNILMPWQILIYMSNISVLFLMTLFFTGNILSSPKIKSNMHYMNIK